MRHLVKGKKLSRDASQRKSLLRNQAASLIEHQRIKTTTAKAKELRRFIEPLITRAKEDTQHNRREVFSKLPNNEAVSKLFEEIGPMAADRPGGYTRVLKIGNRPGDSAEMSIIELVDYNDVKPEGGKKKRKRTRRSGKAKKTTPATPDASESDSKEDSEKSE